MLDAAISALNNAVRRRMVLAPPMPIAHLLLQIIDITFFIRDIHKTGIDFLAIILCQYAAAEDILWALMHAGFACRISILNLRGAPTLIE